MTRLKANAVREPLEECPVTGAEKDSGLMNHIDLKSFLNNPEKAILEARTKRTVGQDWSLFPT